MDGSAYSTQQQGIVWDTENNLVHFDIQEGAIGLHRQLRLIRNKNGKIELTFLKDEQQLA